jgi:hypothetical protein
MTRFPFLVCLSLFPPHPFAHTAAALHADSDDEVPSPHFTRRLLWFHVIVMMRFFQSNNDVLLEEGLYEC